MGKRLLSIAVTLALIAPVGIATAAPKSPKLANRRWAFTLSNAGSYYFEDRTDLAQLGDIDWDAVNAKYWSSCREAKQSEFLMEQHFPWHLVEEIGVYNHAIGQQAMQAIAGAQHKPTTQIKQLWYY
jgi:hypothetical protein